MTEPCLCGALDCAECRGPGAEYLCPNCSEHVDNCDCDTADTADTYDEGKATWALGRIAATSAAVEVAKATAAYYVSSAEKEAARTAEFFTPHLEQYFRKNPPKGKAKSIKLASGTLGTRTTKGGPRTVDMDALVEWAAENDPTIIKTKTSHTVPADAIKSLVAEAMSDDGTGEIPAGVELVDDRTVFYAKAKANK